MHTLKIARLDPIRRTRWFFLRGLSRAARKTPAPRPAVPLEARADPRSGCITRCGSRTPTSTSTITCGAWRVRHRETNAPCANLISKVYAWPLDRSRPLWVAWIIEGLQDGSVAAVFLVHHAYCDGIGAGYLLEQICNDEPGAEVPDPESPWVPDPWPSVQRRIWWALRDLPPDTGRGVAKGDPGLSQNASVSTRSMRTSARSCRRRRSRLR